MSKYNRALKCSIAKQYLQGESSSEELSRLHSIPSRQIRYWAQVFGIHGSESFTPNGFAKNAQTKLQALKHMWTNGWSVGHTSAVLNFSSPGTLSVWLKQYELYGIQGLERSRERPAMSKKHPFIQQKSDDEKTLEELKEELAYLRAENAVLKKLEELEQEKHRRTKKKRK